MANWLKDELAETERILRDSIQLAGSEINATIEKVGAELAVQRKFTSDDLKELIDYATQSIAEVVDERVDKLKKLMIFMAIMAFIMTMVVVIITWFFFSSGSLRILGFLLTTPANTGATVSAYLSESFIVWDAESQASQPTLPS